MYAGPPENRGMKYEADQMLQTTIPDDDQGQTSSPSAYPCGLATSISPVTDPRDLRKGKERPAL